MGGSPCYEPTTMWLSGVKTCFNCPEISLTDPNIYSVWFKADFDSLTCSGSIVTAASMDRNCTKPILRPVLILEALTYEKVHIPESVGNSRAVIWS